MTCKMVSLRLVPTVVYIVLIKFIFPLYATKKLKNIIRRSIYYSTVYRKFHFSSYLDYQIEAQILQYTF